MTASFGERFSAEQTQKYPEIPLLRDFCVCSLKEGDSA
jgi:hypothetical protein